MRRLSFVCFLLALGAVQRPLRAENEPGEAEQEIEVRGLRPEAPRGANDVRVHRDQLEASPRQHASELLSAAPGFFVDHEDGETLGNDVYLRGFDLEHGSGIEMIVGGVPVNVPTHVHGQGYADIDFIIPEVVDQIHVQAGSYDPRQGDAAIVGSAAFELGLRSRGYQLKGSYGSFNQRRVLLIAAPKELDDASFIAFSARKTEGFGARRAALTGSLNAQYSLSLGPGSQLRALVTAYGARGELPGVVREDHVRSGLIDFYGSYPHYAENQGAQTGRVLTSLEFTRRASGGLFRFTPWFMWTNFRARHNYSGTTEVSRVNPTLYGLGDLFQLTNLETAGGARLAYRTSQTPTKSTRLSLEAGAVARVGRTHQTKSLLEPVRRFEWDRRLDVRLDTLDVGGYLDVELELFDSLRLLGGPRVDVLGVQIQDSLANAASSGAGALPGARRSVSGVAVSPRVVLEYAPFPSFAALLAYGEGFRSHDASRLGEGARPYSKVRSMEAGLRLQKRHFSSSISLFQTHVGNELVFVAEVGGLDAQQASVRRGVVASIVTRPYRWLIASAALSAVSARYDTRVAGVSHTVPNVPPLLFRTDLSARCSIGRIQDKPLNGRIGVGYTFMSPRHITDTVLGQSTHALNLGGELRYDWVELGLEVYNALDRKYADSADMFVSNWALEPGQHWASLGTHTVAAPPMTLLGSLSLYF